MNSRAGYSLFEVLIAFAIMTLVLSVVLPRQAELLERSITNLERANAADFAYSRLSELGLSRSLTLGETRDRVGDWVLYQRVAPHAEAVSNMALIEITIGIEGPSGDIIFETNDIRIAE